MSLIIDRLEHCLKQNNVPYHVIHHRRDFSAQDTAADTHTPGHKFLKPVVVAIGAPEEFAMLVVPADMHIDLPLVLTWFDASDVRIVSEDQLQTLFPDCEVGAESPLGILYGMPVFVDPSLKDNDIVTFNAGTHDTAVRMRWSDYARLVNPVVLPVGVK
jgi:Ala-tRNA(Pro) deacylase